MCARAIINAGIVEVVFIAGERYNATDSLELLVEVGVKVRVL
jgi:deoxycytidylate deaminase